MTATPSASSQAASPAFQRDPAAANFIRASLSRSSATGRGLRVLLVDDDLTNQVYGEAMIQRLGFRVALASDGREAVHRWKIEPFDLILMDCHMPVMDGFAAARQIRQGELDRGMLAHTPIVALTGSSDDDEHAQCIHAGMDAILHKPFDPDELLALVGEWARHAAVADAAASRRACNPSITIPSSRAVASSRESGVVAEACRICPLQPCSSDAAAV